MLIGLVHIERIVVIGLSSASKIDYIVDDITTDIAGLLNADGFQVIDLGNGLIVLRFEDFFNYSKDYDVNLANYENYVEGIML